jgi:N-acetylglucosamine kinase-like BadF-type ATPase
MTSLFVGLDLGGTKAALRAESPDGVTRFDRVVPSLGWDAEPADAGAAWIDRMLQNLLPAGSTVSRLVIGAQGLDSESAATSLRDELHAIGYSDVLCLNDAALLVPAAGCASGIGVISGTGAIGIAQDASGRHFVTGGWGWVLGDDAGAAGIVREATRAALLAHDDGQPDDGLLGALLSAYAVQNAERLARAVNDVPTMDNWGQHAGAVFTAADAGSSLARAVILHAAEHLALLVDQLLRRGAVGSDVVAAGGVITHQPRLYREFAALLASRHPELRVHLLNEEPVAGALAIARGF